MCDHGQLKYSLREERRPPPTHDPKGKMAHSKPQKGLLAQAPEGGNWSSSRTWEQEPNRSKQRLMSGSAIAVMPSINQSEEKVKPEVGIPEYPFSPSVAEALSTAAPLRKLQKRKLGEREQIALGFAGSTNVTYRVCKRPRKDRPPQHVATKALTAHK